jgi:hypothetical protein
VSNDGSTGNALLGNTILGMTILGNAILGNAHAEKPLRVRLPNKVGIAKARIPAFATGPTYQRFNLLLVQGLNFVNDAIPYSYTPSIKNRSRGDQRGRSY